jgi:dUTP pyrophosphatase
MLKIFAKDIECIPYREHRTDAGLDLRAAEYTVLRHNKVSIVPCGIHIEVPEGYVGLIFSRSGLSTKEGITLANGVGVIDADYRGEIKCALLYNAGVKCKGNYRINEYDRIAQLVIVPCQRSYAVVSSLSQLSETDRNEGGFGSTGNG